MVNDIVRSTLTTLEKAIDGITHLPIVIFSVENESLSLISVSSRGDGLAQTKIPEKITVGSDELEHIILGRERIVRIKENANNTPELTKFASLLEIELAAFLPLQNENALHGLVLVGDRDGILEGDDLQPIIFINQLACKIFNQAAMIEALEKEYQDLKALIAITNAINTPWDDIAFFEAIYEQITKNIGEFAFVGISYDETTSSISIPYECEDGNVRSLGAFPIGEDLPSILIRLRQPLLLNDNVQNRAEALGAKLDGNLAKSWMGTPILHDNKVIGAFVVQDLEKDCSFTQDHFNFLCTLANQASKFLFSARILDETHGQINKLKIAAEFARDISSALNLDELLRKAIYSIRDRFNFYHAAIFLIDYDENCAVIREATGEAGAQLKRIGHKLAVGSKSIIGFVAGKGESLVINDINNDSIHFPNPMLPDTRAEAAFPLKIGEQILGVLDVQSIIPFSFKSNDVYIFQTLADQLSIAVNNSELFGEIQEHLSQHRLLHHITTSAASGTTLEEALNSAVKGLQVTLGGDRVSILLSDEKRKQLSVKAWVGYSESAAPLNIPYGDGITGWTAAHRRALRVNDISKDARYIMVSPNTRSELALPLIFRNDILGVLNVESEQIGAYNDNDEEMLGTLAGSLAAIIANARLVDQIRKQAERERLLNEISSKIRHSTDIHTVLSTTIQELQRVMGIQKAKISIGFPTKESVDMNTEIRNTRE